MHLRRVAVPSRTGAGRWKDIIRRPHVYPALAKAGRPRHEHSTSWQGPGNQTHNQTDPVEANKQNKTFNNLLIFAIAGLWRACLLSALPLLLRMWRS